jgi:hypothetical protein
MTTKSELKRLSGIIDRIQERSNVAAGIIENDPALKKIVERDTAGVFLSITCVCDEARSAIDEYTDEAFP